MNTYGYTAPPWAVSENIDTRLKTDVTARGGEDWLADCGLLNGLAPDVCEKNAQLMCAAPDLLESLERSRDLLCALMVWSRDQQVRLPFLERIQDEIKAGYLALHKAGHPNAQ